MNTLVLVVVLYLQGVASSEPPSVVGQSFYIHKFDLLQEELMGGYPIFQGGLPERCLLTEKIRETDQTFTFFRNTESFYSTLGTSTSISGELRSDFTMGATLDATTRSISGTKRNVRGSTISVFSKERKTYTTSKCQANEQLDADFVKDFFALPKQVSSPWLKSSWDNYQVFLNKYGSHVISAVKYGSSLYQHTFDEESESYDEYSYKVKGCIQLAGPTEAGMAAFTVCSDVTEEDIKRASHMTSSSRFIARGGTADTRNKLVTDRSKKIVDQFLAEAKMAKEPVQYQFTSIWTLLKGRYIGTEHYEKVNNLEDYYKGYLNYGCNYIRTPSIELQYFTNTGLPPKMQAEFHHGSNSLEESHQPFTCWIAGSGCHSQNDCHYRAAFWCECNGDSCVRYKEEKQNTGVTKKIPYIYHESGWGWHGCSLHGFSCSCDYVSSAVEVWRPDTDARDFERFFTQNVMKVENNRDEL